ncbi:hypothetical protein SLS61_003387 [Didymella pomorum]
MAAEVQLLQPVKLPKGPSTVTSEQQYWNSFTSELRLDPSQHSSPVTHISIPPPLSSNSLTAPQDLFAVTTGSRVQIFSSKTRKVVKTISRFGVDDIARSGNLRRDGRILVAGGDSGSIQAFDVKSRAILKTWKEHKQPVWTTEWNPSELTSLMSCSDDRTVRLWDLPSDTSITTFEGHQDYVRTGTFMPAQSGLLVSGSYDQTVRLWDSRAGGKAVMVFKHQHPIETVLPMPSGTAVLATSDNAISVLDIVAAKPIHMLRNHQKTVTALSLANNGSRLLSGSLDGHVKVFETQGWNVVGGLKYPSPILSLSVVPSQKEDKHIAVGLSSGILSIRTHLSGEQKALAREREKEMKALMEGKIDEYDRAKKRKRGKGWEKRVRGKDFTGESADIVIEGNARGKVTTGAPWAHALRQAQYAKALDMVLESKDNNARTQSLSLLTALRHRSALRSALANRDEITLQPILRWLIKNISDYRITRLTTDVALVVLDLYADQLGRSEEIDSLVDALMSRASSLKPPILPLIVRNPYLSTWLQNAREEPWSKWPMFWTGDELGFGVLASVPETSNVYPLLGRPHDSLEQSSEHYTVAFPKYKGAKYDASTTNLTYTIPAPPKLASSASDLEITLSFLSPITPTSTLRQSIPAAYLSIHVQGSFDVDVYVDVNGQWVSGKRDSLIEWGLSQQEAAGSAKGLKTWSVKRQVEQIFTEEHDQAEWGQLHFTGPSDVRHESGTSALLRQRFARTGTLQDEVDDKFRAIMDEEPVFAFSKSFKLKNKSSVSSKSTGESVLFTITHIQDPVTQYASARGLTFMKPLWKSWFPEDDKVIKFHYGDFANANSLASNYSEQLRIDAYQSGSTNYVDIVALSARQAMGATSFSGTPESPLLFLKEISSNGNSQTVDVIFPAFPFFLYTNPRWLAYLLEPLLEHQLSGQYPNKYSMHDLGAHFPNLTGHADGRDEYMPVEECGDMLIMGLALINSMSYSSDADAQSIWSTVGDDTDKTDSDEKPFALTSISEHNGISHIDPTWGGAIKGTKEAKKWLEGSYDLWKQWTGYLVEDALEPHNQLCTDDFAGWLPLQTNLALKGIIGIKAFSEIAALMDRTGDAKHYLNISESYIEKWQEYGISRDGGHAKLAYDWYGSWTTLYSLYADAVLCFHPSVTNTSSVASASDGEQRAGFAAGGDQVQHPLHPASRKPVTKDFIPHSIYKSQSKWYASVMQKYGLPLDSRHLYTKSDWEFEAAAVASKKVRSEILDRVATWLNETVTDRPFTDLYNTEGDGGFPGPWFFARPVVGGHFAFLTLERACGGMGAKAFEWEEDE